jgi:hypothetical protein
MTAFPNFCAARPTERRDDRDLQHHQYRSRLAADCITDESRSRKGEGKDMMTDEERKIWLAIRKEAGLKIDPETAEVFWRYGQTLDPYGVYPDLPEECRQIGREYFARAPGSDVWVNFCDLPEATRDALWKKHSSKLAFPAGLLAPADLRNLFSAIFGLSCS